MSRFSEAILTEFELALYHFLMNASVPLFWLEDELPKGLCGSGTFFQQNERLFLITAAHCLEGIDLSLLAIPRAPKASNIYTLGSIDAYWPDETDILDVAIIEVLDLESRSAIFENWTVFDESDLAEYTSGTDEKYIIVGCPAESLTAGATVWTGRPYPAFCKPSSGKPIAAKGAAYKNVDIFLDEIESERGFEEFRPESLAGISGSGIWKIIEWPESTLWLPRKSLKLVGVQCSVKNGDFIRGKLWRWVQGILDRA
ncbi:MAG: hypothetical protein ACK4M6_00575 [Hyphomonas sp.]